MNIVNVQHESFRQWGVWITSDFIDATEYIEIILDNVKK